MVNLEASLKEHEEICAKRDGMLKTENDLKRYQLLIDYLKPTVVVETGFFMGGSAKWFAERVDRVISIDVDPKIPADLPDNVTVIRNRSDVVFDDVKALIKDDDVVLVSLDSEHDTDTVFQEMMLYSQLATMYMVVEDGIFEYWDQNWLNGSPVKAIEQFFDTPEGDYWQNDYELENLYPTTLHPKGWLVKGVPISYGKGDDLG